MVLLDIPDLHINHLNKDASAFLIIPIEDFTRQLRILANVTHRPSYHQLFLIQDGIGEFDVNSTKFSYSPETLIAISKGQATTINFPSETSGYALLFTEDFFDFGTENTEWINCLSIFNTSTGVYRKVPSERDYMEILIWLRRIGYKFIAEDYKAQDDELVKMVRNVLMESERTWNGIYKQHTQVYV